MLLKNATTLFFVSAPPSKIFVKHFVKCQFKIRCLMLLEKTLIIVKCSSFKNQTTIAIKCPNFVTIHFILLKLKQHCLHSKWLFNLFTSPSQLNMYSHCSCRILFTVTSSWHCLISEGVGILSLSSDIWERVPQLVPKVLVTPV